MGRSTEGVQVADSTDNQVEVEVVQRGATTVCRPRGELDAFSVQGFRERLAELAGTTAVVIDLSKVPFMDSAGLGALIGGIRRIREAGSITVVVCDRPAVLRLLHTTRFDRMVPVLADLDAATEFVTNPSN
ncbi:MAG: STAS domain-containing protein [Microthrixaceae bacterium]